MRRTSKYLRCSNITVRYLGLLLEILASHSDKLCYLFMIVSMMKTAGFISLIYPMSVFGYALMEEMQPKKKFWYVILFYTEALILLKFVY